MLLFYEADAPFSEVNDGHDRYANPEVTYLLQRMEAYGGLAILTTNLRPGIDLAYFVRTVSGVLAPRPGAINYPTPLRDLKGTVRCIVTFPHRRRRVANLCV